MKYLLFLLFTGSNVYFLAAQNTPPCYPEFRSAGVELMRKKNYGEAMSQFIAALVSCKDLPADHDLGTLIKDAKETWIRELQQSAEREHKAYLAALDSKDAAEKAQQNEKLAREEAIKNAQEAYARGIKAEALRLALQADIERGKGQKSDAMLLAWMSLQMSGTNLPQYGMRAFSEAVRDSFSNVFFNSPTPVESVRFLPSGQRVLLQTADHSFFIVAIGEKPGVTQLPGNIAAVIPANRHDTLLVWEGGGAQARLIGPDGSILANLQGHNDAIRDAFFSADDAQIVTCSRDKTARVWNLKGVQLHVLQGHAATIQDVGGISPGAAVFTRSSDGIVKVWSAEGICLRERFGKDGAFAREVATNVNYPGLVIRFADGSAGIYETGGKPIKELDCMTDPVKGISWAESPWIAIHTATEVQIMDFQGNVKVRFPQHAKIGGLRLLGEHLFVWTDDNMLHLYNLSDDRNQLFVGHQAAIISADLSRDGKNVLTTSKDGTAKLWDLEGRVLIEWSLGTLEPVSALFSPDGQYMMLSSNSGKSMSLSPLPLDIYQTIIPDQVFQSAALPKLMEQYNIQFAEVLRNGRNKQ